MNKIYFEILDFVSLAKKLEYCVMMKFDYHGESVFRGVWDKEIPRKGEVELEGKIYNYFFHGSGVDFETTDNKLHYNRSIDQGLGVHFTPLIHLAYFENEEQIKAEYQKLVEQNLIKQFMPEIPLSQVYYLI